MSHRDGNSNGDEPENANSNQSSIEVAAVSTANGRVSKSRDAQSSKRGFSARLWRPRGLFWKIFGWFLAAQLLIALALTALAAATQRGFDQRFSEMIGVNLEARARAAAIAYESGGQSALLEAWQSTRRGAMRSASDSPNSSSTAQNSVASDSGEGNSSASASASPVSPAVPPSERPPSERPLPDDLSSDDSPSDFASGARGGDRIGRRFERGLGRRRGLDFGSGDGLGPPRRGLNDLEASSLFVLSASPQKPAFLVARLLIGPPARLSGFSIPADKTAFPETYSAPGGATYLLRRVETARGGKYLATLRMRRERQGPLRFFNSWLGGGPNAPAAPWRLMVIVLTMGALCYGLARYLSDPALKLRRATQQFAAGDFATRVGPQMGARRDELADLGHDFDRMAERIEGLLLSQRQLLGDISHELRSPLTRLSLSLELASQGANAPNQALLGRMEGDVGEMNRLIGQLLTIAKLENGASALQQNSREAAYIDLAHLVEHVAGNADFEAVNRGGSVRITQLEACQIVGNGELLHSALENVVRNAILHSPGAPRVEISLQVQKKGGARFALIGVRDHGPGVPEDALEAMFRPFFRVDAARDRQSGGTGLGLSITQRAARFHGGEVRAQNAAGGGLGVEISLPIAEGFDAK